MSETGARALMTPEGVALHLVVADVGDRIPAFLLDLVFMGGFLLALTIVAGVLLRGTGIEVAGPIWILGFFVLRNFYFALFELRPKGATPGKRLLGIRVATRGGGRLTGDAILARNLMRELELFLPLSLFELGGRRGGVWLILLGLGWSGVFTLFPLFNKDRLRVGDLLAGTWVVRAPRRRLLADLTAGDRAGLAFSAAQLGVYGIKELLVLEDVLRAGNVETVSVVAERIRAKIGWVRGAESNFDFLQAYYAGLRAGLERGLLFGQRRRDKFDEVVGSGVIRRPPPLGPSAPLP